MCQSRNAARYIGSTFSCCGATVVALCIAIVGCVYAADSAAATSHDQTGATVTAVNLSSSTLKPVSVTFGEPFRAGDIPKGRTVVAYLDGTPLPTQANIKARNPDGSVRHAILTVQLPPLNGHARRSLALRPAAETSAGGNAVTLEDVLRSSFDASIDLRISGQPWHLNARTLLQHAARAHSCEPYGRACTRWLAGPLVSEWIVGGPVLDAQGASHPHIAVYFDVRAYGPAPVKRVRVDVIVENDWAYQPDPHNITYDAKVSVGGQFVYALDHLAHSRQARWHKVFWWGGSDPVYIRQHSRYLEASRAVPRFDNIRLSQDMLRAAMKRLDKRCGPMRRCDQSKHMSTVGAQAGIGPLPRWTSVYVIEPSHSAYLWMLANSDALGSYYVHYRDQDTGQPVSVDAHPCATIVVAAQMAPCGAPPHANDNFPQCKSHCKVPLGPDEAHHPSPAYVAYLVTGDWYYLEELTFWADWVEVQQNPRYRHFRKGLLIHISPRGLAWALRTLGYTAYILPDNDPFKTHFNDVVKNNIQWYNKQYTDNPAANKLHIITNGYAIAYPNGKHPKTGTSTWQASFVTWSVGNLNDLGFPGAGKLLDWLAAFQVNLMTSPDYCWILASAYEVQVRDTRQSPIYDSLSKVYAKTYPEFQGVACNSAQMAAMMSKPGKYQFIQSAMIGHPQAPAGYPANFQIGLAAAVDSGIPGAREAWTIFQSQTVKPGYSTAPQFAVIPRSLDK